MQRRRRPRGIGTFVGDWGGLPVSGLARDAPRLPTPQTRFAGCVCECVCARALSCRESGSERGEDAQKHPVGKTGPPVEVFPPSLSLGLPLCCGDPRFSSNGLGLLLWGRRPAAPGIVPCCSPASGGRPGGAQWRRRDCARPAARGGAPGYSLNATPSARPWPRPRPARVPGQGRRVLLLQPAREGEGWILEEEFGLNK